jgi:diguanylate cyclase (GGDEF)-like protein/PAS domain S-box-containing protein
MKRQNKDAAKRIYSTRNAIFGYLIGLIFPVLAYLSEFLKTKGGFSLNTFQQFHLENPLFWLVDFIPVFVFCIIYFTPQEEHGNWMTSLFKKIDHSNSYEIFKQKTFYESLVNNSPAAIVTMDADQKIISVNPAFTKMFQYTQEEVHLKDLDVTIAADCDLCQAQEFTQTVLQGGNIHGSGKRRRKDGTLIDVEIYGVPIFLEGKRVGVLGMYIDITDRIRSEEIIKESELRYRSLFHDSPISMWEMDFSLVKEWIDALEFNKEDELRLFLEKMSHFETEFSSLIRIIDVNQATLLLYKAYDLEDLRKNIDGIFIEQSIGPMQSTLLALFNGSHQIETEIPQRTLDGMILHTIMRLSLVNGFEKDWSRVHLSVLDITERKWAEERMRFLTMHDSMTGLYNRAYFETELKRISRGRQFPLSVIVCDLDNLKTTNDQYGHTAGDAIICKTASILLESFRADDIVARLGGDEFAVIIPNLEEDRVFKIVERLQKNLEQYNRTLLVGDSTHRVNLSIGSATTQNEAEVAELFKLADQRMYREKLKKRASSSKGSTFNKN